MKHNENMAETKGTSRIEAFSDAVFAIAITLLVLELIQILHSENGEGLIQTCLHHWQSFLAFTIGFVTILICWINHHVALEPIQKVNTTFMWINGFLLFVVTLTPFPTAILAEYLGKEPGTALSIFGINYILISLGADAICTYAYHHHLIDESRREFYAGYKLIYRYAIFYNVLAFFLCFVSIYIPIVMYAILFTAFAAPKAFAVRINRIRLRKRNMQNMNRNM